MHYNHAMTDNTIRVLVLTSRNESGLPLRNALSKISGISILAELRKAADVLQALENSQVDLVILDLALAETDSLELRKKIRMVDEKVKVLVCTASDASADVFAAMSAGADGYILKGSLSKHLAMAVKSVRLGAVWLDPGIARQVLDFLVSQGDTEMVALPTGLMVLPLMPDEREILVEVASSNCVDGVCMVDPSFLKKLKRFAPEV